MMQLHSFRMKHYPFVIFALCTLFLACKSEPPPKSQRVEAIKEASVFLDSVSYVDGIGIVTAGDSLIVIAKDSFALFDPFFVEEVTWFLAYTILRKYDSIGTVSYNWDFNNNSGGRHARFFVHREEGLHTVQSRYANEKYYTFLNESFRSLKFRQTINALYDYYGAILASDTGAVIKDIYTENILNPFSDYSSHCSNSSTHGKAESILTEVDKLLIKYGNGKGGYGSGILQEVLSLCDEDI